MMDFGPIGLEIKRIDHFGIISGITRDLGICELIDEMIGVDTQEILTTGDVVLGMIINGLGFASRPLMLTPQFFENKALDILIKPGVKPNHFNRHRIGRALDRISEFGCEKFFNQLALSACVKEGVNTQIGHADTTSYELHGHYDLGLDEHGEPIEEHRIKITHGYSKANRPDLKQIVQELITVEDGGIPLITKTLSGNASDTTILKERVDALKAEFAKSTGRIFVADSKLYASKTAETLNKIYFITRVAATLNAEQDYIAQSLKNSDKWIKISNDYKYQEFSVKELDIEDQRWVVFFSTPAYNRSKKTIEKEITKEQKAIEKELNKLQITMFGCESDAVRAMQKATKKWRYHKIKSMSLQEIKKYNDRGRPTSETPYSFKFHIIITFEIDQEKVNTILNHRSCFVLAANIASLSAAEILSTYKAQDHTEKAFAFLKKPEFFTASLNLEKPGRIEAIITIMVLSLLVYSVAQRRLRKQLQAAKQTLPDQLKKPTDKPTMRWIFQQFEGVDLVKYIPFPTVEKTFIHGITPLRQQIVSLLGPTVFKIYQTFFEGG